MSASLSKQRPIAVDLFAGAGGMTLGFESAGFDVLASVEIDPIHCLVHRFNFPNWKIFCHSVTDITAREIRENSEIGERSIDVVFGGPPCQGFSLIGKRALDDPRNQLIEHFLQLVVELNPKYFVMENVRGMAIGQHKNLLQEVIDKFSQQGYRVQQDYRVLNAYYYGVPQSRERLFLLGGREGLPLPEYPEPTTDPQGKNGLPKTPTVRDALKDLPDLSQYEEQLLVGDSIEVEYGEFSEYVKKLRGVVKCEEDYSYRRKYDRHQLTSSCLTRHTETSIERFQKTPPGKIEQVSRFYKLDPDGYCNTLRAGTPGDRGAYTAPRPIHYASPRCITVREAARLHSYPDWFRFHVTKWHGFRQVGNSVPPLLARAIAREIIRVLEENLEKPKKTMPLGEESDLSLKQQEAQARILALDKPRSG
jgi:DNA (cytosine-5)-methyltransferase 1